MTRDDLIDHLTNLTVAPLTTRIRNISSQVILETFDGVDERCAITLDNLQTIPKSSLDGYITTLSRFRLRQLQDAVIFALELDGFNP